MDHQNMWPDQTCTSCGSPFTDLPFENSGWNSKLKHHAECLPLLEVFHPACQHHSESLNRPAGSFSRFMSQECHKCLCSQVCFFLDSVSLSGTSATILVRTEPCIAGCIQPLEAMWTIKKCKSEHFLFIAFHTNGWNSCDQLCKNRKSLLSHHANMRNVARELWSEQN